MNSKESLFSALQFLLVVIVCCAGLFFIALPSAPHLQYKCAAFLVEREDLFVPLGSLILAVGAALGVGFYFLQRRYYFQVSMKPPVDIEPAVEATTSVIRGILDRYWKETFPSEQLKVDAVIHADQKIELIAELPLSEIKPSHLKEIEKSLGRLLTHQLGYRKKFLFTFLNKTSA